MFILVWHEESLVWRCPNLGIVKLKQKFDEAITASKKRWEDIVAHREALREDGN